MDHSFEQALDDELIADFFQDFREAYERCERSLLALETQPDDSKLTNDLFRSVHTIKGNLIYIGLKQLSPLLQSVEDVLEELRGKRLIYNEQLSDVVLLAMDLTNRLIQEQLFQESPSDDTKNFSHICQAISHITDSPAEQRADAIYQAILALDPDTNALPPIQLLAKNTPIIEPINRLLTSYGVVTSPDLDFFAQLMPVIEQRSHFWQDRSWRLAELALKMNDAAGRLVDPSQLAAAVYMHDIGMAFLPDELLHKQNDFNSQDKRQIQAHVRLSADILHRMRHWEEAAEIVLQHHEHCDGQGYPKQLVEAEICHGAKILSIVDAFDSCMHGRSHQTDLKRPLIRSVLEVNRYAGSQFSQFWVDIFNRVEQSQNTLH